MERRPVFDIGVGLLIIAICSVVLWQASRLPPGSFEPLGSGPVPQVTAAIVILCCLVVVVRGFLLLRREPKSAPREAAARPSSYGAIVMFGGAVAYVAALHLRLLPFGMMTFVFLLLVIWALEDFERRALIPSAVTAAIVGFGVEYLFTRVFVVDLPV